MKRSTKNYCKQVRTVLNTVQGRVGRCEILHTVDDTEPIDYCLWFEWAEKKSKTHRQKRCPECGLYKIWVLRKHRRKP